MTDTQFDHLLRPLGIIRTKNDYYTLRQCMTLICTRPDRLRALQKEVYLPVAEASGHAWRAVESAVRRTAKLAWKTDLEKCRCWRDTRWIIGQRRDSFWRCCIMQ